MILQIPNFAGLGAITESQIQRELAMRGVYVEEAEYTEPYTEPYSEPYTQPYSEPYTQPYTQPEPTEVIEDIDWDRRWDIMPLPDRPVVVIPRDDYPAATDPWLPTFPYIPGPELEEEFTAPFTEELTLPLTDVVLPGPVTAGSKVPLIVGAALVAWAAMTKKKPKKRATWRKSKASRRAAA